VARLGIEVTQVLAELGDTYWNVRSGEQSGFENDYVVETTVILTQASIWYAARVRPGRMQRWESPAIPGFFHKYYFDAVPDHSLGLSASLISFWFWRYIFEL
jgi:hypothetical protein